MSNNKKPVVAIRKPNPVAPRASKAAEDFVAGATPTSKRRMTVYIEEGLAERLRVRCAINDVSASQGISEAVEGWLKDEEKASA